LLENAAKYSPVDSAIEVATTVAGGQTEITVADRGAGIPAEDLERVFDKFHRVSRAEGASGTGLGLAISRGIVEAHGGQISAHARPGGGTVVRVVLPLEAAEVTGGEGT
jgi:two-component system sensor histidine kinase KdpD